MKFSSYSRELSLALDEIKDWSINNAIKAIRNAKTVYVAGNGGSAAISDHLCCDFFKSKLKVHSFVSNGPLNTMLSNDYMFERCIAFQVERYCTPEDVLILISSSGDSKNIINACEEAKLKGVPVIGMTGFRGGRLGLMADISIWVNSSSYGVIEDCHQAVMHHISRELANRLT